MTTDRVRLAVSFNDRIVHVEAASRPEAERLARFVANGHKHTIRPVPPLQPIIFEGVKPFDVEALARASAERHVRQLLLFALPDVLRQVPRKWAGKPSMFRSYGRSIGRRLEKTT